MPVPKAAMDEDRALAADVGDVGIAGNVLAMQPITRRECSQHRAHGEFGRRVAPLHRAHDGGTLFVRFNHPALPALNRREF